MTIPLSPHYESHLSEQAKKHGYDDPARYLENLLEQNRDMARPTSDNNALRQTEARQAVQKMRGTATGGLSADQIMDESRSEI